MTENKIQVAHGISDNRLTFLKTYVDGGEEATHEILELETPEEVLTVCDAALRWIKEHHPDFNNASRVVARRMCLVDEIWKAAQDPGP